MLWVLVLILLQLVGPPFFEPCPFRIILVERVAHVLFWLLVLRLIELVMHPELPVLVFPMMPVPVSVLQGLPVVSYLLVLFFVPVFLLVVVHLFRLLLKVFY